ncbi:hypothetical protein KAU11_10690 [Candidatus Babeliales bacterium]|nr:hypothetical protein [Candidatus Babeliales bacterium]
MKEFSIVTEFYNKLEEGQKGLNKGIPFTVDNLTTMTGGILKDCYYLILGKSKTGKSSFMYEQFIFNIAYKIYLGELKEEDYLLELYSLEISIVNVLAKAAVWFLLMTKGAKYDTRYILGYKGPTTGGVYKLLTDVNTRNFLYIIERITKTHSTLSPVKMKNYLHPRLTSLSTVLGTDSENKPVYRFKNSKLIFILMVDHISLSETGTATTKQVIDSISSLVRKFRNSFGITAAIVQQITPGKGVEMVKVIYGHEDARDSKNTFQDCDICISIGSPFHDKISSVRYKGGLYHIFPSPANEEKGLKDTVRFIGIEKDRNGASAVMTPSTFIGQVGSFQDIPLPEHVTYPSNE